MKKRFLATALAAVMAATLFAGCGSSAADSASSAAGAGSASAAVSEAAEETASSAAEAASSAASEAAEETAAASSAAADASGTGDEWIMDMDNMLAGSPFDGLTANGDYTYQLIVKAFSASFFTAVVEGANAAASDLGVSLDCMGPNTESDIAD